MLAKRHINLVDPRSSVMVMNSWSGGCLIQFTGCSPGVPVPLETKDHATQTFTWAKQSRATAKFLIWLFL